MVHQLEQRPPRENRFTNKEFKIIRREQKMEKIAIDRQETSKTSTKGKLEMD